MVTSAQLRAGRALVGIDQPTMADMVGVSLGTIQRLETAGGPVRGTVATLSKIVGVLKAAGVEMIAENSASIGQGCGVRLSAAAPLAPLLRIHGLAAAQLTATLTD